LTVDFFQLYIDIMQKLLNTHSFAPYSPWQRICSTAKTRLLAQLTLMLIIGLGFTNSAKAAITYGSDYLFISGSNPAVNGTYFTNNNDPSNGYTNPRDFKAQSTLGTYDRASGSLLLGGEANTTQSGNDKVGSVDLLYRIYPSSGPVPSITAVPYQVLSLTPDATKGSIKWKSTSQPNLLTAANGTGEYVLDLFFSFTIPGANKNTPTQVITDRPGNYQTTFTVTDVTGVTPATWLGRSPNWSTDSNWSSGKAPTPNTDVTIPYSTTRGFVYPQVFSLAQARTLTIMGAGIANKATVTITTGGDLQVFGDLRDPYQGLAQDAGYFTLAGTTQTLSSVKLRSVRIQGGGRKFLSDRMEIVSSLEFVNAAGGGILVTGTNNAVDFGVNLNLGAAITGEDEANNSYVEGILNSVRIVEQGILTDFGNIGIDLLANAGRPGYTTVTRLTNIPYDGVGVKGASVKRSFEFAADNMNDLGLSLTFHYMNIELNGNDPANLAIFTSPTNTSAFTSLGRSAPVNTANKIVRVNNISNTLGAVFTLGQIAPLPVTLVSFTATPTLQGAALLRWVTAKELNNKGFGIERTLGTNDTWKEVGYLATTNTPNGKSYEYTDKSLITAPASTQAYYRLRQEDLDGKVTYSPVAAVARQAALASTGIVLSPVPLDGPNLSVSFAEAGQAGQEVAIINTQGQRMLHFTTQNNAEGTLSLPVANLAAGVYIVRIQTPGQAVRHARFVKL
jgi:hypothetical protein